LFTSLGHEAVVIFFVLCGFVIAFVADTRETDFRGFMVARGARIFSVAIPAIILTALLDYAGLYIHEAVYPEGYRAWDYTAVRVITSSLFLNEIWTLGIQLFTNVPDFVASRRLLVCLCQSGSVGLGLPEAIDGS
jgi:peptidoglycan/LPS O-acetylase OafA/YrhL